MLSVQPCSTGAHQIFTKLAADKISDGVGGFVVEASAALTIRIYLGWLRFAVGLALIRSKTVIVDQNAYLAGQQNDRSPWPNLHN